MPPDGSPSSNARYFDAAASTDEHDGAAVQARSIPRVPAAAPSAARQACCRAPRRSEPLDGVANRAADVQALGRGGCVVPLGTAVSGGLEASSMGDSVLLECSVALSDLEGQSATAPPCPY